MPTFPMMTVKQVAAELSVTTQTVYSFINSNQLKAARLGDGGVLRIRRADFESFIESLYERKPAVAAPQSGASEAPKALSSRGKPDFFALGRKASSELGHTAPRGNA